MHFLDELPLRRRVHKVHHLAKRQGKTLALAADALDLDREGGAVRAPVAKLAPDTIPPAVHPARGQDRAEAIGAAGDPGGPGEGAGAADAFDQDRDGGTVGGGRVQLPIAKLASGTGAPAVNAARGQYRAQAFVVFGEAGDSGEGTGAANAVDLDGDSGAPVTGDVERPVAELAGRPVPPAVHPA